MLARKKSKPKARKKVIKASVKMSGKEKSVGLHFLWSLLALVLKVLGIAFVVQGFILQLATGVLYYGLLHYAIGVVLVALAWHTKFKCSCSCS